jgi:hypothetical protein
MTIAFYYTDDFFNQTDLQYRESLFSTIGKMCSSLPLNISNYTKDNGLVKLILIGLEEAIVSEDYQDDMVVIFYDEQNDNNGIKKIKEKYKSSLIGLVNKNDDIELFKNVYSHILKSLSTDREPTEINEAMLEELYTNTLNELERIKKIHSVIVPMREETYRNIKLYSKFAAGLAKGGEFFDVVDKKNSVTLVVGSFSSYLGTSIILNSLETLKKSMSINKNILEEFIEDFTDRCRDADLIDRDYHKSVQLDVIHIDLQKLNLETFHFGLANSFIATKKVLTGNNYSLNENFFERSYQKMSLSKGSRYFYFSPGAVENFEKQNKDILKILTQFKDVGTKELVNESMFQIKKNSNDFLDYDASIIFIEVGSHAITQV